jgi:gluconolactonase
VSLEGPFWDAQNGRLLFSDVVEQNATGAKIYALDAATRRFSALPYPQAPISTNGLAVDARGNLVTCERWNGVVARVSGNDRRVLAERTAEGQSLNAPNDIAIRADGNIYFTDTTWGAKPGAHAATAVYRISTSGELTRVLQVEMPNGIALSPNGDKLYVGSDTQNRLWRLPVARDGSVGTPEPFANGEASPQSRLHVPDGLCVDDLGRIYVSNNSDDVRAIVIFDEQGHYAGRIALPAPPSNCTFGGPDRRTLYVTTLHALYEVQVATPGLP